MTKPEDDKPYEERLGGSYVIDKNGAEKRVAFTRDDHLEVKPAAPAAADAQPPGGDPPGEDDSAAKGAPTKKGK